MKRIIALVVTLLPMSFYVHGCGKKNDKSTSQSEGSGTLPSIPAAAGQVVFTLDTAVDANSVAGYIVGKKDLLKVERASTGEFYINNVPAGQHDVVIVATSATNALMNALF